MSPVESIGKRRPPDLGTPVVSVSSGWVSDVDSLPCKSGRASTAPLRIETALLLDEIWWIVGPVTADGSPVKGVAGNPLIIEAKFAQEESFELLVPMVSTQNRKFLKSAK